jgi:RND family efflux transporter MFP subunit
MNVARVFCKPGVLLLSSLVVAATGCDEKHPQVVATPPPVVEVSLPVLRQVTDYQVFTARTAAVESVDIKARVTGYLTEILFKDGDEVAKGKVLFQIDDRPYKAALDLARETLKFNQASLKKAQADLQIGLDVQKQSTGAISQQDIVKREAAVDEAKASVGQALASLEKAQLYFDWCTVTSPISGRINRHFIDAGNMVSQDVSVLTNIVSLKPTWAYFDVDENTALNIQRLVEQGLIPSPRKDEAPVEMTLASGAGHTFKGTINFISNQLDPNTGSLHVRAVFPNEDGRLGAGLFGRIKMPTSAEHAALLVNDQAIGTNQGQKYILVVNDKKEVEYRIVDVGQLFDGMREVTPFKTIKEDSGGKEVSKKVEVLKATDRVIVDGLQRARPGTTVEPRLVSMQTLMPESSAKSK